MNFLNQPNNTPFSVYFKASLSVESKKYSGRNLQQMMVRRIFHQRCRVVQM